MLSRLLCSPLCTLASRDEGNASRQVYYIRHMHPIRGDKGLDTLVRVTIAGSGALPFIHGSLTAGKVNWMGHRCNARTGDF